MELEDAELTPLWYGRCVKALVEAGAHVDMQTKSTKDKNKGAVALHYAAQENKHEIVEYLIRMSAGVNVQDSRGCTPLHYAAYKGVALCIALVPAILRGPCQVQAHLCGAVDKNQQSRILTAGLCPRGRKQDPWMWCAYC